MTEERNGRQDENGEWFPLIPGEKVLLVVGMPGPDVEECEVLEQDGGRVKVRFQVLSRGPFYEEWKPFDQIIWWTHSDAHKRFKEWKEPEAVKPVHSKREIELEVCLNWFVENEWAISSKLYMGGHHETANALKDHIKNAKELLK